jgi:hypothetical protein
VSSRRRQRFFAFLAIIRFRFRGGAAFFEPPAFTVRFFTDSFFATTHTPV